MSEKLVVHSGGKLTRKTLNNGILACVDSTYASIAASASGNYVISYDGSGYSLLKAEAAATKIDHVDTSFFPTTDGTIEVATSGTIPYFTSTDTFSALDLPSTNGIHILYVTTSSKTFTKLTASHILSDILDVEGLAAQPAFPLWNGTSASSMKLPSAGSWYMQKDSQGYNWVKMDGKNVMTHCWGLSSSQDQLIQYSNGSVKSIIMPSTDGNYALNRNNGAYSWTSVSTEKQSFMITLTSSGETNITTTNIAVTSGVITVFSADPSPIPSVTIGKKYRLTFHLNAFLEDTAVTEKVQYSITLSGSDLISCTLPLEAETSNTLRLTFDTIITPTNSYISFSIIPTTGCNILVKKSIPSYLIVQEI